MTDYVAVQVAQALLGRARCWLLFLLGSLGPIRSVSGWRRRSSMRSIRTRSSTPPGLYAENLYFPLFFAFAYLLCRASWRVVAPQGLRPGRSGASAPDPRDAPRPSRSRSRSGFSLSRAHAGRPRRWRRWIMPAAAAAILVLAPWTVAQLTSHRRVRAVSAWGWAPFYHGIQCLETDARWDDLRRSTRTADRSAIEIVVERLYGGDRRRPSTRARKYVRHEEVARDLVLEEIRRDPLGATAPRRSPGSPSPGSRPWAAKCGS